MDLRHYVPQRVFHQMYLTTDPGIQRQITPVSLGVDFGLSWIPDFECRGWVPIFI